MLIEFKTNNEDLKNERLLNVSILRVVSMFMIVLFHCMCFNADSWTVYPCALPNDLDDDVSSVVVSLALPVFFFISGFLFVFIYNHKNGYRDWKTFTLNKFNRLILPTITWTIIYLIILPFRYTFWDYVSGIRHLWFLPTLFVVFLIARLCTPYLLAKRKLYLDVIIVLAIVLVSCAINAKFWSLLIGKVSCYISFFMAGMMYCKCRFTIRNKIIELIILLILICIHAYNTIYLSSLTQIMMDDIILIVICCLLFDLLAGVKMDKNSMPSRILSNLDKNSLGIYLVHQVFIMTLYQYTMFEESWLTFHPYIGPILLFIIVLPLSWAFAEAKRRLKLEPFL